MLAMTEEHFRSLLVSLFPKKAEFRSVPNSDGIRFAVSWKLKNDPARPNKRSRRIILTISRERVEDYEDGDERERNKIEKMVVGLVTQRLKQFNPDHKTLLGQLEPEELWTI